MAHQVPFNQSRRGHNSRHSSRSRRHNDRGRMQHSTWSRDRSMQRDYTRRDLLDEEEPGTLRGSRTGSYLRNQDTFEFRREGGYRENEARYIPPHQYSDQTRRPTSHPSYFTSQTHAHRAHTSAPSSTIASPQPSITLPPSKLPELADSPPCATIPGLQATSTSSSAPAPKSPTAAYLNISLTPSTSLDPSSARKLLVLDLNGTLLIRSPRPAAVDHSRQKKDVGLDIDTTASSAPTPLPRPRHVYPRPYLPAFCAYLFSPCTRQWLDTMVWSSAQPYNVQDMVSKCFGEYENSLVAVWSRDTLGLTKADYHRKCQTTKDLTKPWVKLPLISPATTHCSDLPTSSKGDDLVGPQAHSALATILLDDSPLKAHLQPWNHVCIPEYSRQMRANDLQVWEGDKSREANDSNKEGKKKRKKKKKGKGDNDTEALVCPSEGESSSPISSRQHLNKKYDETLLAVVGVLDAIKGESNVSGWIRAGGLRGVGVDGCKVDGTVPRKRVPAGAGAEAEIAYREVVRNGTRVGSKRKWKSSEEIQDKHEHSAMGGDDFVLTVPPGNSSPLLTPPSPSSSQLTPSFDSENPSSMVWFEHPVVAEHWATRGRRVLETLGIDVIADVC